MALGGRITQSSCELCELPCAAHPVSVLQPVLAGIPSLPACVQVAKEAAAAAEVSRKEEELRLVQVGASAVVLLPNRVEMCVEDGW